MILETAVEISGNDYGYVVKYPNGVIMYGDLEKVLQDVGNYLRMFPAPYGFDTPRPVAAGPPPSKDFR